MKWNGGERTYLPAPLQGPVFGVTIWLKLQAWQPWEVAGQDMCSSTDASQCGE